MQAFDFDDELSDRECQMIIDCLQSFKPFREGKISKRIETLFDRLTRSKSEIELLGPTKLTYWGLRVKNETFLVDSNIIDVETIRSIIEG